MGSSEGINPELLRRFNALAAAAQASGTSIGIGSGYRSVEQQIDLRRKNGCPDVWTSPASSCRVPTAIPGHSNHNHGLAIDITGDKAWANAHAAEFGLHFPVPGENWHMEMIDDEGSHGFVHGAEQMGAIGFDLNWQEHGMTPEERQDMLLQSYVDAIAGAGRDALLENPAEMTPEIENPAEMTPELGTPGQDQDLTVVPEEGVEKPVRMETQTIGPEGQPAAGAASGARFEGNVPPPGYVPQGEGVDRWRDVAIAALRYTGQDPAMVDVLLRRMSQESGGNPMAVNNWDVNAKRGDPSKGLMQNIGSAFPERARELANRGIYDGFANIVASIRYTLARYGSLTAGWNRPGGY